MGDQLEVTHAAHLSVNERLIYISVKDIMNDIIYFSFVARAAQCYSMDVCMRAHDAGMLGHNTQLRQCNIRVNQ